MMSETRIPIGTVVSDEETPTFEVVRIKLKAGCNVRPGALVSIPCCRDEATTLIGRVRAAYEHNPNERAEDINVRDTLGIRANYPQEEDSTTIYRQVEADLIEEITDSGLRAPQTLPQSGTDVLLADSRETVQALGLAESADTGLLLGTTSGGLPTPVILKRDAIQRHMFISGTSGSGKSYAMGVVAEEIQRHGLPMVFIDTQDEYSPLAADLGGNVVRPGIEFTIRVSSLTESEFLRLLPASMSDLQRDIAARAFSELQAETLRDGMPVFSLEAVLRRMDDVGPVLTNNQASIRMAISRTSSLSRNPIFGDGIDKAEWQRLMQPCLCINCKGITSASLQPIATAVLRELQTLRLYNAIPPYVVVIDEAHLFVPQDEDSPCKQIIREGVRIGRHHGICVILLTQSPVDIDRRAIRQCNTRMVFALEPDQLSAIQGVKADAAEEMLRALPKMPRGTCLLSGTYESVKHAIPVMIRERETPEGGAAPDIFTEMSKKWIPARR